MRNVGIAAAAALIVIVAVLAVVGRSSHSPTFSNGKAVPGPRTAGTPNGYKSFVDQTDHFSIAVPAQWREVDPASPGAAAAFQQLEQDNPKLKVALGSNPATLLSRGMKFFSVEPNSQAAVAPNVNVLVEPAPGIQDSDVAQGANKAAAEIEKTGATVLGTRTVTLDGHQALQVSLRATYKNPLGNSTEVSAIQYILGANDFAYFITLTGTSSDLSTIVTTFHTTPTAPAAEPASTTTTFTPATRATAAPGARSLAGMVIPAPAGFAVSHSADARNGPMTATELNKLLNSSTVASESHFVDGYHADYDSITGSDTIEVILAEFATEQDAQGFRDSFVPSDTAKSVDDPAIPGADDFNSTAANPDGSFDHGVIAAKGRQVMVIDYLSGAASAVPAVATLARQQYAKLSG